MRSGCLKCAAAVAEALTVIVPDDALSLPSFLCPTDDGDDAMEV